MNTEFERAYHLKKEIELLIAKRAYCWEIAVLKYLKER